MACNVCGNVVPINCNKCGTELGDDFYCFSDEEESHHFCSGLCFEQWLVSQHQSNLEPAEDDEKKE